MKKYFIVFVCLLISIAIFGQETGKNLQYNIDEVEVTPPSFTGVKMFIPASDFGSSSLLVSYLRNELIYPEKALKCYKEGTEVVQFKVSEHGELSDFKVLNSVCREIDDEVISALKTTNGMWKPGTNNGNYVPMEKEISMTFCVDRNMNISIVDHFKKKATAYFNRGNEKLFEDRNFKKALKNYQVALRYLPYEECLLTASAICKNELNDREGAQQDLDRLREIAENGRSQVNLDLLAENFKNIAKKEFQIDLDR